MFALCPPIVAAHFADGTALCLPGFAADQTSLEACVPLGQHGNQNLCGDCGAGNCLPLERASLGHQGGHADTDFEDGTHAGGHYVYFLIADSIHALLLSGLAPGLCALGAAEPEPLRVCVEIDFVSPRGHTVSASPGGGYHGDPLVFREDTGLYPCIAGGRGERQGALVEVVSLQRLLRGYAGLFKIILGFGLQDSGELAGGSKRHKKIMSWYTSVLEEKIYKCVSFS